MAIDFFYSFCFLLWISSVHEELNLGGEVGCVISQIYSLGNKVSNCLIP